MKYQDINIKIFWKVHIRNFDEFVVFICNNYKIDNEYYEYFKKIKYDNTSYFYYCVGNLYNKNKITLFCVACNDITYELLISEKWKYEGEYIGRKKKLKRLNEISGH